ncbi:MAG TPA: DUF411 domain-containing protein [Gammaproteobacteria bacterium]|nr:DUF411 domain-containing protein [Gammaproteobacteria bacterium]
MKTYVSLPDTARIAGLVLATLALAACGRDGPTVAVSTATAADESAKLVVYEGPRCGCCGQWGLHMEAAGFEVEVQKTEHLAHIKPAMGVPAELASCHTAKIRGYFVEGHVPAREVQRLLAERPAARGLAVTGMPAGSPGMEAPDGRVDAYEVLLVAGDGATSVYARYPE